MRTTMTLLSMRILTATFLSCCIQLNFHNVIGQQASFPSFRYIFWEDLDPSIQFNAEELGYDEKKWNKPWKNKIEQKSFENLKEDEQAAARAIGFTAEVWNCWINHYSDFEWKDLQDAGLDPYFEALGWTQDSWESDETPVVYDGNWDKLSADEQSAANEICYFEQLWNEEKIDDDWPSAPPRTKTPTLSPSLPKPTISPTGLVTASPTLLPTVTSTDLPTPMPSPDPSTHLPTPMPSPEPSTHLPTPMPSPEPSTHLPTPVPSPEPSTHLPTPMPSPEPPTQDPTLSSSANPTVANSSIPTEVDSDTPTLIPTATISDTPSAMPTNSPSTVQTFSPPIVPTITSTAQPSTSDNDTSENDESSVPRITYFERPRIFWTAELPQNHSGVEDIFSRSERPPVLGMGNGITSSPDNKFLYITRGDGGLDVLSTVNGELIWVYHPERNKNGWDITCRSQVYFGENEDVGQFLVYAIIDKPPENTNSFDSESRIVAISIPDNNHMWTSEPIPGAVVGTPVITRNFLSGRFIFVVHNAKVASSSTTTATATPEGHFSILAMAHGGMRLFTESSSAANPVDGKLLYGPMGVTHFPTQGKYGLGQFNSNDLVVWTTNTQDGETGSGYLRAFQIPAGFDESGDDLFTVRLSSISSHAAVRPTLTSDGLNLFVGVRPNEVRGWVGNSIFTDAPTWTQQLMDANNLEYNAAIPSASVLSNDEKRLFVPSSAKMFYAIDAESGGIIWQRERSSIPFTEGAVSPDGQRIYSIGSSTGSVYSQSQSSGSVHWVFKGGYRPVEAEWCLSDNGLFLYYGDIFGRVQALSLGFVSRVEGPSPSPTITNSSHASRNGFVTWIFVAASVTTFLLFI